MESVECVDVWYKYMKHEASVVRLAAAASASAAAASATAAAAAATAATAC